MSCKSFSRSVVAGVMAGACAALFAIVPAAHAQQLQVLGASPPAQDSAPELTISQRLILHDINVSGLAVDPDSRPVLDYAVQLLRQYPGTRVYVSGEGDRATIKRQAQAVARYLEQRGISANRLVLEPVTIAQSNASTDSHVRGSVIVLNLTAPGCATCSS
jgi:outer membrane protein OmpA-like peptidoglycan-associated protein